MKLCRSRQQTQKVVLWSTIAGILLLVFSLDALVWGVQLQRQWPAVGRGYRLRRNPSQTNWEGIERGKRQLPRFHVSSEAFAAMPTWVISLERSVDRRAAIAANLNTENLEFDFVAAVDGQTALELDSDQMLFTQQNARRKSVLEGNQWMMGKVGADLSHVKVMHRILGAGTPFALILEDDALLVSGFKNKLYQKLSGLPEDWDVLFLQGCYVQRGTQVLHDGLYVDRESMCMMGYVARASYAMRVLQAIFTWKLHTNIDNLVSELIRWGELQAYITDPFLVQPSQLGFNSTVELWPHDG